MSNDIDFTKQFLDYQKEILDYQKILLKNIQAIRQKVLTIEENEKFKYETLWELEGQNYTSVSPGATAFEKFNILEKLRELEIKTILDAGSGGGEFIHIINTKYSNEFSARGFDLSNKFFNKNYFNLNAK
ncbi:MAG: hypothetical protein MZU91_05805 [Desulfosudis oleivorans]|nr:hypothetical protein [Desulfosudis oleivorans]